MNPGAQVEILVGLLKGRTGEIVSVSGHMVTVEHAQGMSDFRPSEIRVLDEMEEAA